MEDQENRANNIQETQKRWFRQVLERALETGEIDQDELDHWMRRLKVEPETARKAYDRLRQMGVRIVSKISEPELTPQARQTLGELLEQCKEALSEREYKLFVLRYLEGKTAAEIAEQEGISPERVCQLNNKVIRKLRSVSRQRREKIQDFYE